MILDPSGAWCRRSVGPLLTAERRVSALANSPRNDVPEVVRPVDG